MPDDPTVAGLQWGGWNRCAMGLRSSPYQCVQAITIAEEFILGDHTDENNVFSWDSVRLNLPGAENYDPALPRVSKIRSKDGRIAADLFIFVDEVRLTGSSQQEAWLAARRAASLLNHLGIQDAPRKRRDSSTKPGAWAGSVLRTDMDAVNTLVSEDKWSKTQCLLKEVKEMLSRDPTRLNRKRLEQIRGYLIHITRTYTALTPYLIGFHLRIDSWRPNRGPGGWKLQQSTDLEPVKNIYSILSVLNLFLR